MQEIALIQARNRHESENGFALANAGSMCQRLAASSFWQCGAFAQLMRDIAPLHGSCTCTRVQAAIVAHDVMAPHSDQDAEEGAAASPRSMTR